MNTVIVEEKRNLELPMCDVIDVVGELKQQRSILR